MKLTVIQEQILKEYGNVCSPQLRPELKPEINYLMNERFIHRAQNHITDKGLAYLVAEQGYSFTKFLRAHKWEGRLQIFLRFARSQFQTDEELDIYFKAKYKANLKYDTWSAGGAEQQLPNDKLKVFVAEMFLELVENPAIDWQKVVALFMDTAERSFDLEAINTYGALKSREEAQRHFKAIVRESQAQ